MGHHPLGLDQRREPGQSRCQTYQLPSLLFKSCRMEGGQQQGPGRPPPLPHRSLSSPSGSPFLVAHTTTNEKQRFLFPTPLSDPPFYPQRLPALRRPLPGRRHNKPGLATRRVSYCTVPYTSEFLRLLSSQRPLLAQRRKLLPVSRLPLPRNASRCLLNAVTELLVP